MTVTWEAYLVDRGQSEWPAVAEAEAEPECVPAWAESAVAGLGELFGATLQFDYG